LEFPLVSILIPAYNHAKFVRNCLDSVLEDSYPNKEIVIINDGSTDDSDKEIAAWKERNSALISVKYINRGNRGVAATLNELAENASGEFFRLVASDDYLIAGGIRSQIDYLIVNPAKGAVIGDSIIINDAGEKIFGSGMADLKKVNKKNYFTSDGIRKEVICHWVIGGPVTMITKKAFQALGGWSEDLRIEDWDFFLRLIALDLLGFVDTPVGGYRLHDNNTCRTQNVESRVINLGDAERVAHRNLTLFNKPYRTLLKSQWYLIRAKIAYLKRKPFLAAANVFGALFLMGLAKLEKPSGESLRSQK